MTGEEVTRKFAEAFNRHDSAAAAALYATDAVVYDPFYPEPLKGRQAIQQDAEDFFRAFPDAHMALRTNFDNGNTNASEVSVNATHKGPLATPNGDIPATGRSLKFDGGGFTRRNDKGEIVEERRYYDAGGILEQLGVGQ
jgi:steroid delta-isomerase-like uncharacterized protein